MPHREQTASGSVNSPAGHHKVLNRLRIGWHKYCLATISEKLRNPIESQPAHSNPFETIDQYVMTYSIVGSEKVKNNKGTDSTLIQNHPQFIQYFNHCYSCFTDVVDPSPYRVK